MNQLSLDLHHKRYMGEAREFIAANPEWWRMASAEVGRCHAAGLRTSMKQIVEVSRYNARLANPGKPYRISNNLTSSFARILLAEHPEYADTISTRRADCAG